MHTHNPLSARLLSLILLTGLLPSTVVAQRIKEYLGDESVMYAETKQVNQFFRRFNGEEALDGNRYYPGDSLYHNPKLRHDYLEILFDEQNPSITPSMKSKFISSVRNKYLNFHGGEWFAEVTTTFLYNGREMPVTLFLKIEEAQVGSKWVFTNVYFQPFSQVFEPRAESGNAPPFIHPLSHELDFMNLIKIFRKEENVEKYAENGYSPDYLTLFLYELKRGNLTFQTVKKVKFHFFQIDGWYFELSEFMRSGYNRGWLISQMTEVPPGKKDILLKYIYHQ
ncbi:MAG: hypothetical protein R3C61_19875 [Bacteroidia bacterium]